MVVYQRSDNKFLHVADWQRAQQLLDQQVWTNWPQMLEAILQQVHPLHPDHLGYWPLNYNWTVFQSEWATDVVFQSAADSAGFRGGRKAQREAAQFNC